MSEEQPPGDPERPEAQPPRSSSQGPKPFWRRTPFLMAAPPLTLVMIITIVGCVSASTSSPASSPRAAAAAGSPSSAAGSPSANAAGSPSASGSPAAPDPAVAVCQGFAAIYPYMKSQLLKEAVNVVNPVTSDNWKLDGDANKMAHWTYVMTQAINNGTSQAPIQFANDLGDASTDVGQSSFPPTAISAPDPLTALTDIDRVSNDCSALTGG